MVIWYAIAIYIVGIAVVLYMRPVIMFRDDGVWKEFGVSSRENFTVFPFWMFALVWSILSFALANLASMFIASVVAKSSPLVSSVPASTPNFIPVSSVAPSQNSMSFPASSIFAESATGALPSIPTRAPGYYVLEGAMNGPRYVYWGPEPPRF